MITLSQAMRLLSVSPNEGYAFYFYPPKNLGNRTKPHCVMSVDSAISLLDAKKIKVIKVQEHHDLDGHFFGWDMEVCGFFNNEHYKKLFFF